MSRTTEGALLAALRDSTGLTIETVESQTGIPSDLIKRLEDGENINEVLVVQIAKFFKVVVDDQKQRTLPGT